MDWEKKLEWLFDFLALLVISEVQVSETNVQVLKLDLFLPKDTSLDELRGMAIKFYTDEGKNVLFQNQTFKVV